MAKSVRDPIEGQLGLQLGARTRNSLFTQCPYGPDRWCAPQPLGQRVQDGDQSRGAGLCSPRIQANDALFEVDLLPTLTDLGQCCDWLQESLFVGAFGLSERTAVSGETIPEVYQKF